jgi:hypothetical protein
MKFPILPVLACTALAAGIAPARAEEGPVPLTPAPATQTSAPAKGESEGLRMTSDTMEYCTELHDRVDGLAREADTQRAEQARDLTEEGERLCKTGRTRSGILRLRRAYILVRPPEPLQVGSPAR